MSEKPEVFRTLFFWLSLGTSLLMVGVAAFYLEISYALTIFIAPFAILLIFLVFVGSLIYSIVVPLRRKQRHVLPFVPLIIHVAAIIIILTVPFTNLKINADWRTNLEKRMEVVRMVESGELVPDEIGLIALPRGLDQTSKGGGKIMVEWEGNVIRVLFYYYRGMLGHFSGYVYRPDDTEPKDGDFGSEHIYFEKKQDHWFWIVAGDA
ncbi:MAG: hypothetical protein KJ626_15525 [Verrucomicrobia bacterium]|nr:hypothetical protein [Verrucomicrobiota bacterium]